MRWYEKVFAGLVGLLFCLSFMDVTWGEERGTETWETFTNANFVNALAVEGDYIWAGTGGGVVRWDTRDGTYIKHVDNLLDKSVRAVAVDGNGVKWFGTGLRGVSRFDGSTWKTYTKADGLASNYVNAIAVGLDGVMWFGTPLGVSRFDGTTWKTYTEKDGLVDNDVEAIAVGPDGAMWFGTHHGGVSRFDGTTWKTYATADGLAGNYVRAIAVRPDGAMWFGTANGLSKLTFSAKAAVTAPTPPKLGSPETPSSVGSLILVAGGGAAKANTLWETINNLTNYIYKIFHRRGFEHIDIYYINPDARQDFNGDGFDDHIVDVPKGEDRNPAIADLEYAITKWAVERGPSSEPLYIYMVDHGGKEKFKISPGEEISAKTLDSFLDTYQSATGNSVVVIIEACLSGSFVPVLSDRNRVIITSAAYVEDSREDDPINQAYYGIPYGNPSFTRSFVNMLLQSMSLKEAFDFSKDELSTKGRPYELQKPYIDDDGDGKANTPIDGFKSKEVYVGGKFGIGDMMPEILETSKDMVVIANQPVNLFIRASDLEGELASAWAVVVPPDFVTPRSSGDFDTPLFKLPTFPLSDEDRDGRFEGVYNGFTLNGEYKIIFYVKDRGDNITSSTLITVTVTGGVDVQPVPPREGGPVPPPQPSQASIKAIVSSDVYRVGDTIEIDVKATGSGSYDQYLALLLPPGDTFICLKAANRVGGVNEVVAFKKDFVPDGLTHRVLSLPILMPIAAGAYSFYAVMVPSGADLLTTPMEGWIYDRVDFRFE